MHAADIAYYLSQNKTEAERISGLAGAESQLAVSAIDQRFCVASTAPPTDTASQVGAMPAPSRSHDKYDELLKLDELRKKGILTQAEFDEQKKSILAGQ